ncbi:MAG: polysaccharide deacetylase family protein [Deltaproteobacteria bacterium]|nr:polysaccharide deacetylase family protein [Deltaproteobacteria bacterium]
MKKLLTWVYRQRLRHPQVTPTIMMLHDVHPQGYTPQLFTVFLLLCRRFMDFYRLDEACTFLREHKPFPRPALVLTFDDGMYNNLAFAYPILRKYRIPATFFVVPGLVSTPQWIWTHEVTVRLYEAPERHPLLAHALFAPCSSTSQYSAERLVRVQGIVQHMKTLADPDRQHCLGLIQHAFSTPLSAHPLHERYRIMTWEEIAAMDFSLIEIGSHSYSHPILTRLPPDDLEQEGRESATAITAHIHREPTSFCYPDGAHDDTVVSVVRHYYRQAVTTTAHAFSTLVDFYHLPRLYIGSTEDTVWQVCRYQIRQQHQQ